MKPILIINLRKLSNNPTGIGMYTYNLVNALLKISSIKIIGITDVMFSKEIKYLKKHIKIISYGKEVKKNIEVFKYYTFIRKILKQEYATFFWEPNNIIPGYLKLKNVKIITTIHDFFAITDKKYISKLYRLYFVIMMYFTLIQTQIIICVSFKTTTDLLSLYKNIIKNKFVYTIYNIVNFPSSINQNNFVEEYYLYIGTLNKRKGGHLLLEAYYRYVLEVDNPKKLILAGKIEDNSFNIKIQKINKIKPKIIEYYGYIDTDIKNNLLKNCNAFIFPSLAEGFGIPPIEALYYNKPLILSNLPIFYEILGLNNNYFVIENDENKTIENLKECFTKQLILNTSRNKIINSVLEANILKQLKEVLMNEYN